MYTCVNERNGIEYFKYITKKGNNNCNNYQAFVLNRTICLLQEINQINDPLRSRLFLISCNATYRTRKS